MRNTPETADVLTRFCPIPCFGSLSQPKIPTPATIKILIYLLCLALPKIG